MYEAFFGLKQHPFSMAANPGFLWLTPQHREALAGLTYAIVARRGISVLTGDPGTGKTTILGKALQYLPGNKVSTSLILNPTLKKEEFLEAVLQGFGIDPIPDSKTRRLLALEHFVRKQHALDQRCALIVDEAHTLSPELLEEVRLLGNLETGDQKLLQILLLGQSELDGLLNRESLRQFKQRIALRFTIGPLASGEVGAYIRHRWEKAGGVWGACFGPEVISTIAQYSKGYPRLINALCDNALVGAFGCQSATVTVVHVHSAARDLQITQDRSSAPGDRERSSIQVTAPAAIDAAVAAVPAEPSVVKTLQRYARTSPMTRGGWFRWRTRTEQV